MATAILLNWPQRRQKVLTMFTKYEYTLLPSYHLQMEPHLHPYQKYIQSSLHAFTISSYCLAIVTTLSVRLHQFLSILPEAQTRTQEIAEMNDTYIGSRLLELYRIPMEVGIRLSFLFRRIAELDLWNPEWEVDTLVDPQLSSAEYRRYLCGSSPRWRRYLRLFEAMAASYFPDQGIPSVSPLELPSFLRLPILQVCLDSQVHLLDKSHFTGSSPAPRYRPSLSEWCSRNETELLLVPPTFSPSLPNGSSQSLDYPGNHPPGPDHPGGRVCAEKPDLGSLRGQ